jgi:hypothetical protein
MQRIGFDLSRLLIGALILAQISLSFTVCGENIASYAAHQVVSHLDTDLEHHHVSAPEFLVTDQAEQHDHQSYASSLDLSPGVTVLAGQPTLAGGVYALHRDTLLGTNHPLFRPPRNSPVNA